MWSQSNNTSKRSLETKTKLLIALYNNAKTSQQTRKEIFLTKVPDPYLYNFLKDLYKNEIDEEVGALTLEFHEAIAILKRKSYIDYIGPVAINIDFSANNIDTKLYDQAHQCDDEDIRPAHIIISDIINAETPIWKCNLI